MVLSIWMQNYNLFSNCNDFFLLLTDTFLQKDTFVANKTGKVSDYVKKVLS